MQKIVKRLIHNKVTLFVFLGIIIGITPYFLISLFIFVLVGVNILRTNKLSIATRLVLSYAIFYSFLCASSAVAWFLNIDNAFTFTNILYGVALLFAHYYLNSSSKNRDKVKERRNIGWLQLVLLGTILFILFLPYKHSPANATLVQNVLYQADNTSHIDLVYANVREKSYVYLPLEEIRYFASQTLSGYPQGWHINVAYLQSGLDKFITISGFGHRQIMFFLAFTGLQYAVMISLLYQSVLLLFGSTVNGIKRLIAFFGTFCVSMGVFMTMYAYGFQTQYAATLLLLLLIIVLGTPDLNKRWKPFAFALSGIFIIGISTTWQLIALPAGLVLLLATLRERINSWASIKKVQLKGEIPYFIPLLVSLGAFLFQFLIQVRYGNEVTTVKQPGLIPAISTYSLIILLLLALLALSAYRRSNSNEEHSVKQIRSVLLLATFSTAILAILLFAYLEVSVGELRYYYYKNAYTLLIVCLIPIIWLVAELLNSHLLSRLKSYAAYIVVAVIGMCAVNLNISLEGKELLSGRLANTDRMLAQSVADALVVKDGARPIQYITGSCIPDQDFKAFRLVQALSSDRDYKYRKPATPFDEKVPAFENSVLDFMSREAKLKQFIISDKALAERAVLIVNQEADVQVIDIDNGTKKDIQRCPNFVGFK